MSDFNRLDRQELDNFITGRYGEDQFRYDGPEDDGQDDGLLPPDVCATIVAGEVCSNLLPCALHTTETPHVQTAAEQIAHMRSLGANDLLAFDRPDDR